MQRFFMILAVLACLGVCLSACDMGDPADISVGDPDVSACADGEYTGSYGKFPVKAVVQVHVRDGALRRIDLKKHQNGKGDRGAQVVDRVLKAQSLNVDAVSGATWSSRVILKAIDTALSQGIKEEL
ncbi:MAG: FMN-binding protein [Fibrobacterota bacterium]